MARVKRAVNAHKKRRVILERAEEPDNALYLRSHGKSIVVGAFLSPQERRDLAEELCAVLSRHRSSPALG